MEHRDGVKGDRDMAGIAYRGLDGNEHSAPATKVLGYIGKCRACKSVVRFDVERPGRVVEHRSSFSRWQGVAYPDVFDGIYQAAAVCKCGARIDSVRLIKGVKTEQPCGAKCTGAKGHDCECSCGGVNHGKAFAA